MSTDIYARIGAAAGGKHMTYEIRGKHGTQTDTDTVHRTINIDVLNILVSTACSIND